ncbi:conserved hypothetical protein [Leishmania braziliensis MHOM/BR/75/M2904]|uniref:MI domain-containing protein n=3 Tax=Viannia TaxID=37616 RepID=A4HI69_LEIBR|nr:conserved hypothetical protein [Leishmania braziliensis MHOM/BR/75/M2904]CAJ2477109.1 unnamed protein product [Leishmania braziliensis]CAM40276.1 conserved hypothetical protein [Leishmania braziliensis MHOM/BR/75/M2904]SYZ67935.1 MA3_domain_containing_protein [Leishmania braziliensis MHOM/BR/75/M2904]
MRRGVGQFNQAYGRGNCSRREDQRCGSYNDRGGRGRSFRPDSSSSSRYDSPHQQQHGSYGHYGSGASRSFSALDADSVADRQRDRKARRRQERQEKKQLRIERHEQWTQKSQKARQEARNSRAADQIHQQRKRLRAERALTSTAAERNGKRHKGEQALKEKSEKCVRATASDCVEGGPATSLKADTCKSSTGVLAAAAAATAVSPATSLAEMTPVPAEVTETVRRLVNKLTTANVVDLTRELSDYMLSPGVSPVSVVKGLAQQIERLCLLEAGPLSTTGTLPFAGLLRGMQLLHGIQLGSELVERISFSLKAQLAAAEEAAAGNTLMVLVQLYLLYGVDVVFVTSLLRTLLRQGTRLLGHGDDGGATTSMDSSSSSPTSASAAAAQAVCAAACGLALMRACGEKLLKESPAELEASLQEARRASAQMRNITGMARFSALVEVMGDIAAGRTRKARRTTTEEAAPAEAMLEDLCLLLPGQERAISTQRRTMKRLVLTTNIMSGLTWEQVTSSAKPPRWYIPGVMMTGAASDREEDDKAAAATAGKRSCIVPESKEGRHSREISALQPPLWTAADESEQVEEMDEAELKRERIARMRTEEKALSGQRLNTEHKREIFRCIATATDDLECFTMLMYRDPGYTRFHDACAVLLQCAYQERKYNPYYAQVLMRFCSAKPACVKTLQFAIWDRFKSIRIESTDVVGYFNFACCIADLMQHGVYNLSLLRGLDLENTNKTIGLFARMLLLRLIFQLPALRLTQLFFGGDGCTAHDLQVDTSALRRLLTKFMSLYFIDENASKRWLPSFYEVVAAGTSFDVSAAPEPQTAPASRNGAAPTADADKRAAKVLALQLNTGCSPSTLLTNASAPFRTALSASKSASSAEAMFDEFMKRVQVAYRALKQGIV